MPPIQDGWCTPTPFTQMGAITAQSSLVVRQYMVRLSDERKDPVTLDRCAAITGFAQEVVQRRFQQVGSDQETI
ncbi:MAG: hypothetical protein ACREJN_02105 [Nitrospiraceae bacterium]